MANHNAPLNLKKKKKKNNQYFYILQNHLRKAPYGCMVGEQTYLILTAHYNITELILTT